MKSSFSFLVLVGAIFCVGVQAAEQQFTTTAVKSDKLALAPFVRRDVPLNAGWTFTGEEKVKVKGEGERTVDLPHDYQFEQPWTEKAGGARGFKACGTKGVYENTFAYDPAWDGKRVFLEFEAIMTHGEIEVNGKKVGECDYGYLGCTLDVTDLLVKDKPNTVRVTCSTGSQRGSRWYTGGGLIRPVHIIVKSPVSVVEGGLFVRCEKVGGESRWTAAVQVQLDGYRGRGRKNELKIWTAIKDPDGKVVGTGETIAPWSKLRHQLVDLDPIAVANPKLWDIDSPNLYTCEVKLVLNGAEIDQVSDRFGFRTVEFGKDFGLKLNGRKVWVFGMANHHDLGALGAAAFDDGIRRMMRTIKRFGYNTIRCAHNPYSKGFYRIADEEGLLVIDELYDKWGFGGGTWWIGSKTQRETWPAHVKRWMMRDRNHPSVILWSLGNEFQMNEDICGYDTDDWGVTTYRMMREYARRYDPTRLTTAAMFPSRAGGVGKNDPKDLYDTYTPPELATVTDVSSFNYQPHAYAGYLERAPWMILLQSEATTSEWLKPMNLMDRAKMVGLCYWGAIEYWGESNRWPKKGWNYSFFNETLEPYPTAWLITSGACPDKPIVHLGVLERGGEMTNWNEQKSGQDKIRENWTREPGSKAQVVVFSNRDEVELFLNGRSLGKKSVPHGAGENANVVWYRDVPWEPGELKAVAGGALGDRALPSAGADHRAARTTAPIAYSICSAGSVDRLAVKIDYEGEELVYARIVGVDAEGRENLAATGKVRVTVSGGGKLYALSNGDHATDELFTPDIDAKALHDGTLQAIVRKIPGAKEPVKIDAQFADAPVIRGARVYGARPGSEIVYRIPTTGARPIVWSADGLPEGLRLDGQVLRGRVAKPGEYALKLRAKNAAGESAVPLRLVVGEKIQLTPPMGWNSWYSYSAAVSQADMEKVAERLVTSGLADFGYAFVNIDDCWQGTRDANGDLSANERFPDMKAMCAKIHGAGLKCGIYSTPWICTYAGFLGGSAPKGAFADEAQFCPPAERVQPTQFYGGYPNVLRHRLNHVGENWLFARDARRFADWGFDFIKVDWKPNDLATTRRVAGDLRATGRDIVLALSNDAPLGNAEGLAGLANTARTTGDIKDEWRKVKDILLRQIPWQPYLRPGFSPDPDILQIGSLGRPNRKNRTFDPSRLTPAQQRFQMAAWCLLQAPLIVSCDLENLTDETKAILCDAELLAIDQDEAMIPATFSGDLTGQGVLVITKRLADGRTVRGHFDFRTAEVRLD